MDEEKLFTMINLKVRTEYSFRKVYGKIDDIINNTKEYAKRTIKNQYWV
jgi:hypothetical protein